MTTAADPVPVDSPQRRRLSRMARQGRVGILRNTNEPPRPPSRKTALTGRWLSLRSSRRRPEPQVTDTARAVAGLAETGSEPTELALTAIRHHETGQLAGIDVRGLMASVEGLGTSKPIRTAYGAQMRPEQPSDSALPPRNRPQPPPSLVAADVVTNDVASATRIPSPPPEPAQKAGSRHRRSLLLPVLGGMGLAFVILVLIPALMTL